MIFDHIDNSSFYGGLGARFTTAFDYLRRLDAATPVGRFELEGDALFVLVQADETKPLAAKKFEAHRLYADVQLVLSGSEVMGYSPLGDLEVDTLYDQKRDRILYRPGSELTCFTVEARRMAIFLPQDAHMAGITLSGESRQVKKAVAKVRLM